MSVRPPQTASRSSAFRPRRCATGWPYVNPLVCGGLRIPGEASVDSFGLTLAYAEVAAGAGARLLLDEPVAAIEQQEDRLIVTTARRRIAARYVVNAAGLRAAEIAAHGRR